MGHGSFQDQLKHRSDPHKHLTSGARLHRKRKAEQIRRNEKNRQHCDANSHRICLYVDSKGNVQADSSASIGESARNEILREAVPKLRKFLNQLSPIKASRIEMKRECEESSLGPLPPMKRSASSLSSPYSKRSRKRRRSYSEDIEMPVTNDNLIFVEDADTTYSTNSGEEGLFIGVNDNEKITEYLHDAFTSFQQINCRTLCKSLIRTIEPKKQVNFPYNGNLKPKGTNKSPYDDSSIPKEADPEETKPKWWPAREVCPHKEPDHIKKEQRLGLLGHMLLNTLGPHIKCSVSDLKNAFATDLIKIKPAEKADILQDVWKVAEQVERFREGLIDKSATVPVQSRKEEARMLRGGGRTRKASGDVLDEDEEGEESGAESQDEDSMPSASLVHPPSFHPQIRYGPHILGEDSLGLSTTDGRSIKREPDHQYGLNGFESFRETPGCRLLREHSPLQDKPRDHLDHGGKFTTSFGSSDNIGVLPEGHSHDGMFPPPVQTDIANWSIGTPMVPMHYTVSPSQPGPAISSDFNPMLFPTNHFLPARQQFMNNEAYYAYSPEFGHFPTEFGDGLGEDQRHQLHSTPHPTPHPTPHHLGMNCHTPTEGVPSHANGHGNTHGQDLGPHVRTLAGG